ncbi:MAG: dienelactone hydrolase family protein, partial [Ilumatobacteraceae bacterium]|nr:dienelactone hydrolase family protein [Ilumatobacteraceae bacterium]
MTAVTALDGWEHSEFTAAGITHGVFRRGSGPLVIVIHEIPGITPKVRRFAEEVVDRGFTVAMPILVGTPGRPASRGYLASTFARVCVSSEFTTWAVGRTSPIIGWLRALGRSLHAEVGGSGIGAVGMCFSGGFALGMMVDELIQAPVLSQPSLPIAMG